MKFKNLLIFLGSAACLLGFSGSVFAQACTNNYTYAAGDGTVTHNNCGNNATLANICGNGIGLNFAGVDIYKVTLGAGQNFTFSATTADFTPQIALIGSTCSSNANCIDNQTIAATGTTTSATITGQAAGTYFILVGDSAGDSPGCGSYDLSVSGTLPVKLQNFSIN